MRLADDDRQVTETDMYFLQDEDTARQLVELGYRGSGDTLQRLHPPLLTHVANSTASLGRESTALGHKQRVVCLWQASLAICV